MNRENIYLWGTLKDKTYKMYSKYLCTKDNLREWEIKKDSKCNVFHFTSRTLMWMNNEYFRWCNMSRSWRIPATELRWVHRHEPLSYHDSAWPGDVGDPPSVLVGHRWCFKEWIIHIAWDYWVICGTVWSLSQGIVVWCFQGSFSGLIKPNFVSVITKW